MLHHALCMMVEDDHQWKTTFGGRQPLVEDDLRWKMTFSGTPPLLDNCMLPTLINQAADNLQYWIILSKNW